jgi:drug/metabolite transporter (DMT)-like permease
MPLVSSAPIHLSPMPTHHDAAEASVGLPRLWRSLSLAAAGLAGVGSILGFGYATAPGQLAFLALTCLPILVTPLATYLRGHEPGWAVMIPAGVLFVATTTVLARTLRGLGTEAPSATGRIL